MSKQMAFQGRSQLKVDGTPERTPKTAKKLIKRYERKETNIS